MGNLGARQNGLRLASERHWPIIHRRFLSTSLPKRKAQALHCRCKLFPVLSVSHGRRGESPKCGLLASFQSQVLPPRSQTNTMEGNMDPTQLRRQLAALLVFYFFLG